jgi:DNA-binding LytR/AlgR family response regulator
MKVVIIEDEEAASTRLARILAELNNSIQVVATLESISKSVAWFRSNPAPDLIFADIQLADGPSFEILKKVEITAPVIFITAYDAYALQAFRFNGIDYLLKPIKRADVEQSLQKLNALRSAMPKPVVDYREILTAIADRKSTFQKRFIVRIGQTLKTVEVAQVAYFYTEERIAFSCLKDGKRFPLDFSLDELEAILDPAEFFRINRQFIIHIGAIDTMSMYSKSRVKLTLIPAIETETLVSSERAADFKEWLQGKG